MSNVTTIKLGGYSDERLVAMIKDIPTTNFSVKLLDVNGNIVTLNEDEMSMLCEVWKRKRDG